MKPSRVHGGSRRIEGRGRLTAVLLGIAGLCDPSLAGAADVLTAAPPSNIESPGSPEIAAGGTVVLRGSRPKPSPGLPAFEGSGTGYQSTGNGPASALPPRLGWDRDYDTSGFDRTGIDRSFDRSGLSSERAPE